MPAFEFELGDCCGRCVEPITGIECACCAGVEMPATLYADISATLWSGAVPTDFNCASRSLKIPATVTLISGYELGNACTWGGTYNVEFRPGRFKLAEFVLRCNPFVTPARWQFSCGIVEFCAACAEFDAISGPTLATAPDSITCGPPFAATFTAPAVGGSRNCPWGFGNLTVFPGAPSRTVTVYA